MKIPILSLLAAAGLIAGCSTSNVNTVSRSESQATPEMVGDKRIITDASLGRMIRIVGVNEAVVSGNLKKIQVTLENAKNNPRTISYKFEWVNKDGMATGGLGEMWKPLQFGGRETKTISAVATSPQAVDFTLKLAEAR
ncbi:MAG: YcfL family protein [Opitutaceae bacterium]|nr:YcfL family protein [Opitutaceae bacterium]